MLTNATSKINNCKVIVKSIFFVLGNSGIIFISLHSAGKLRSYGLLRFFAFESLLILILSVAEYWFRDPLSIPQIFSWLLLIGSIVEVSAGFYMLRSLGKTRIEIDDTNELVTRGIYNYIRHPLYGSLILLGWGAFLKDISALSLVLALLISGFSIAIAKVEEKEDIRKFSEKYVSYKHRTKLFIPFII
jgi:protein-S-isoprenylcysteine O-methyltransferase Ste14